MDPTIAQYASLAAQLGLAGFMAIMLLTWDKQRQDRMDKERKEREKQAKLDSEKCKDCMEAHNKDCKDMLERVLLMGQETSRFMEALANKDNAQRRMDQIEKMVNQAQVKGRPKHGND